MFDRQNYWPFQTFLWNFHFFVFCKKLIFSTVRKKLLVFCVKLSCIVVGDEILTLILLKSPASHASDFQRILISTYSLEECNEIDLQFNNQKVRTSFAIWFDKESIFSLQHGFQLFFDGECNFRFILKLNIF